MGIGPWELAVIFLIVIIVFGVGKLPEVGTGLGEGIRNFKNALQDRKSDSRNQSSLDSRNDNTANVEKTNGSV